MADGAPTAGDAIAGFVVAFLGPVSSYTHQVGRTEGPARPRFYRIMRIPSNMCEKGSATVVPGVKV